MECIVLVHPECFAENEQCSGCAKSSVPTGSQLSYNFGSCSSVIEQMLSIAFDQHLFCTSRRSVPDSSEYSVQNVPESLYARQSFGSMILHIRAKLSGSFSFIHRIFGAANPANAISAVYLEIFSFLIILLSYSVSFPVRPSFHKIAGLITSSCSSSATSPCTWPPKLIPAGWL